MPNFEAFLAAMHALFQVNFLSWRSFPVWPDLLPPESGSHKDRTANSELTPSTRRLGHVQLW